MTYSDSAKGVTITRQRAMQELRNHGVCHPQDFALFDLEMGIAATYPAHKVLHWLGY